MQRLWIGVAAVSLLASATASGQGTSLTKARQGFKTKLKKQVRTKDTLPSPPPQLFRVVDYPTKLGPMKALLSKPRDPKQKHAAMVWITGGFPCGGIGESAWKGVSSKNDQSAKDYRLAGMVMMYPTLRGSYGNPGAQEAFLGEVDDVIAAATFLAKQPYVDADRIYLGGHSTGGTLALLVAASTSLFKGVFSFGPVANPLADYGPDPLPFDGSRKQEAELRSPVRYLDQITSPTWVIEGTIRGNASSLHKMRFVSKNPKLKFCAVKGATHFDVLAPVNALIAKTLAKGGTLDAGAIQRSFTEHAVAQREAADLSTLARLRRAGVKLDVEVVARHYVLGREAASLNKVAERLKALPDGFGTRPLQRRQDRRGRPFFILVVTKKLRLKDLETVFATTRAVNRAAAKHGGQYDGWDVE